VTPQIVYTTRIPKPQPTPAPVKAPAPAPDRITIDWGQQGRLHINRSKAPESDRQQKPQREIGEVLRPTPVETQRGRVEQVDRYSKLERVRRPKPLWEDLAEQKRDFRVLEYLAVLKVGDCEYAIAERATGENFVNQVFETREHCAEAAAELERVFDMAIVLETRLTETMERIDELVEWHYLREWVAIGLV
jgi:hypothetical protein